MLAVTLVSVSTLAQNNPPFDPDDGIYPEMRVYWDSSCFNEWCISCEPGDDKLDGGNGRYPINKPYMTSDYAGGEFCNASMEYDGDGSGARAMNGQAQRHCREYFAKVKESMISPCQYVVAYGVSVTGDTGDAYGQDLDLDGEVDGQDGRLLNYLRFHIKDNFTPPETLWPAAPPPNDKEPENVVTGNNRVSCAAQSDHLKAIQFRIDWEPDCKDYDYDDTGTPKCPTCYENRNDNPNGDIKSQGCLPQTSGEAWGSVTSNPGTAVGGGANGGPKLGLGDFYDFGSSGASLDMFLPTCALNPLAADTPFNEFDADRDQTTQEVKDQFDRIDDIYGGIYADAKSGGKGKNSNPPANETPQDKQKREKNERKNQYRGECGRGKFFYNDPVLAPKDSNLFSSYPPKLMIDKVWTSEIWESRTGCYNPEERFVHLPPYVDFDTEEDVLPAPLVGTQRIKYFEPAGEGRQLSTGSLRDGPPDEPEGGAGDSEYFVPDDRLLMEHPLCTMKVYGNTMGDALNNLGGYAEDLLNQIGNNNNNNNNNGTNNYGRAYVTSNGMPLTPAVIQDMTATAEDRNDIKAGALPMCLDDDYLDDVDNYCLDLLKFVDDSKGVTEFLDEMGLNNLIPPGLQGIGDEALEFERRRKGKYNAERYYFNYDNFCWEQDERPLILPPDPYERWMPLAIRSVFDPANPDNIEQAYIKKNLMGENTSYWITDIRRPTFTPYAERHLYDYTEFGEEPGRPEDSEFINLSLEEYGYGDIPHLRLDYAFDPTNIYNVDPKPTPADLLLDENRGRKHKLQQCLRMYLEQWAFEGDKGAILVNSAQAGVNIGNKSDLTSDISMCQWVAYYDTSKNYTNQRDAFKRIMQLFLTNSGTQGLKAVALSELIKNDNDAKRGLRPEYFDYMNFMTASILPVEVEDFNLTNKTEVDGGEHYYDDLYNRLHPLDPKKPEMGCTDAACWAKNLPTPFRNPQKINFAKRDCETVVPPQFWRDTIRPFWDDSTSDIDWNDDQGTQHEARGCHEVYGFKNIVDLPWTLTARNAAFDNDLTEAFADVIREAVNKVTGSAGIYHWMTTQEDTPVLSLVSAVPSLPVFAIGIAPKNINDKNSTPPLSYFVTNMEKFDNSGFGGNPSQFLEIRDVWMSRSGGESVLGYHLVQKTDKGNWKLKFPGARLGMIVLDEEEPIRGKEWIDHSFPARDCMHMQPLLLGRLEGFWDNPISTDPENVIQDAWKNWDDIRLDWLSIYLNNSLNIPGADPFNDSNHTKNFGGFRTLQGVNNYYQWLPTVWSMGFGVGKNFWCEFEVPYFPYFIEDTEFNHAKKPVGGHFKINNQLSIAASFPLEKKYKPRLEYYRVERIRDACGPFGVASTWVDDPNNYISDWLLGKEENGKYGRLELKSRCADWYDSYRRKTNDPKIIGWRLPRFDYEFLKAFLECTGPIKTPEETPPVCRENTDATEKNQDACQCEIGKGIINFALFIAAYNFGYTGPAVECIVGNVTKSTDKLKEKFKNCDAMPLGCNCNPGNTNQTTQCVEYCSPACVAWRSSGASEILNNSVVDCFSKYQNFCEKDPFSIARQLTDGNMVRALDYCTRGDTDYSNDWTDLEPNTLNKKRLGSLEGFDNSVKISDQSGGENWQYGAGSVHSVDVHKFWLQNPDPSSPTKQYSADDPFGFWCKCPADDPKTTRCREDFCTCQQHVFLVGRNMDGLGPVNDIPGFNGGGFIGKIQELAKPVTTCKWYGPYLRWLQCFYQARAKACPVVTREISDTPPYDSVYNPFRGDKKNNIPNLPEVTQKSVVFNTCTIDDPDGTNLNNTQLQILDYLRWSKEEPNHLARLPVWFESGGAGYKSKDLVFQTQTRRWESPFMELAVPFPIDLITRNCSLAGTAVCGIDENDDGEYNNNLLEIKQRKGLGPREMKYTFVNNLTDEYSMKRASALLNKEDNSIIRPTGRTLQNANYMKVYERYIAGLYAAHLGFRHQVKPQEPWDPTDSLTEDQDIHPRAQEAIVGPRGCDIGGWYEMMLYQARCIRWWKLNCICDYDKTFAIGNDTNYVLKRAGATFKLAMPALYGAKYKVQIATQEGSSYAILPSVERNIEGKSAKPDLTIPILETQYDADGNPIKADDSDETLDINTDQQIVMPLADRGVASPEYAKATRTTDTDYILTGLDNVQVGDIIIWGEYINFTLSDGRPVDAGYPRHVAYVESVQRNPGTDFVNSFQVSEMNWGKNLDSCGNTNRWGRVTNRTIVRPTCPSNADASCPYPKMEKRQTPIPGVGLIDIAGSVNTYASCQNADWAMCVEKNWDQIMIYRPLLFTHSTQTVDDNEVHTVTKESDPLYFFDSNNNPICLDHAEYPKPLTLDRFQKIMNREETPDGGNYGVDPDLVEDFLDTVTVDDLKGDDGKFVPERVKMQMKRIYKEGRISETQFRNGLWKLMLDNNDYITGYYAYDEVEKALFDASNNGGVFGRCDPPGELRDNVKKIEEDYKVKHNLPSD